MQASLSRTEHTIDRVGCQLLGRSHLNCFRASLSQLGAADQRTHAHLPFFNSDCKLIFVLLTLPLVLSARIHRYVPSTRGNRGPEVCVDHRRLSVDQYLASRSTHCSVPFSFRHARGMRLLEGLAALFDHIWSRNLAVCLPQTVGASDAILLPVGGTS